MTCRKCHRAKDNNDQRGDFQPSRSGIQDSGPHDQRGGFQQSFAQGAPKPGDWNCSCGELNFAKYMACRRCRKVKDFGNDQRGGFQSDARSALPQGVIQKPGDWNCACGELNFARNQICRKCKKANVVVGANGQANEKEDDQEESKDVKNRA